MKLFSFKKRQRSEPVPGYPLEHSEIDQKGIEILKLLQGMRMCDAEQALFRAHTVMLHWHETAPFVCLPSSFNPTSEDQGSTASEVGHG